MWSFSFTDLEKSEKHHFGLCETKWNVQFQIRKSLNVIRHLFVFQLHFKNFH